jgi:4-alpha-glucanotransferase
MNPQEKVSGILLHISSLPSPYGIGTLGKEAFDFVDFLSRSQVKIWQMLPLSLTSYGDSPYQSPSAKGLSYYFIDLRKLSEKGLLSEEDYADVDFGSDPLRVSYGKLFENRVKVLWKAFARFDRNDPSFQEFVKKGEYSDFAFFMTLKVKNGYRPWYEWDESERNYTPELEKKVLKENPDTYLFYLWTQYEFLDEYFALKKYAHEKGIRIVGDMPLYLSRDSVEAYKYPEMFLFDENHNPTVVAGCPPDYFSPDGQLWGNPIYDWKAMEKNGFAWFNDRIRNNLMLFDILRIDHFRGVSAYYTIPFGAKNARNGKWVEGPGFRLFKDKTSLPIIAEDLGFMDEGVKKLLKESTYPGMKVLEFAFDGDPLNSHKPTNSGANYFAYTGTHDNMPLRGYLESLTPEELELYKKDVKKQCAVFAVPYQDETLEALTLTTDLLCYAGPTEGAILPLQDLLALGAESRMNEPSTLSEKNWSWRAKKEDFSPELCSFLTYAIHRYGR